jgi:large subunit ribosomal protein L35
MMKFIVNLELRWKSRRICGAYFFVRYQRQHQHHCCYIRITAMSSRLLSTARIARQPSHHISLPIRSLSTQDTTLPPAQPPPPPAPRSLDPNTITSSRDERRLLRSRVFPIGSRRRRAAIRSSQNIPFEQLPYQCFQEARKVLAEDRSEKLDAIEQQRARIDRLKAQDANVSGGEWQKARRMDSMQRHLEKLKIHADINDPMVKKRFEDGGGMFAYMHVYVMAIPNMPYQATCLVQFTGTSLIKNGARGHASSRNSV